MGKGIATLFKQKFGGISELKLQGNSSMLINAFLIRQSYVEYLFITITTQKYIFPLIIWSNYGVCVYCHEPFAVM